MATTVKGRQIRDSSVEEVDLANSAVTREKVAIAPTGKALIRKAIQGTGISMSSTGDDPGTGDVTFSVSSSFVQSAASENLYFIKAYLSADYTVPNTAQLETVPLDATEIVYDASSNRFDTSAFELTVAPNEVWDIDCTILLDYLYAWSVVIYDTVANTVVASAFVSPSNRYNTLHVSSLYQNGVDPTTIQIQVYCVAGGTPTIRSSDPNGLSPITICNFKRKK